MVLIFSNIIKETLWGLTAKIINIFIPVKEKYWVFASDYGNMFREGSKYLLTYMIKEHPDYHCSFITQNSSVINKLKAKGITCYNNFSVRGIIAIAQAECIFFTQYCDDIYFAYHKSRRQYFFLVHGMPYKRAFNAVPKSFINKYSRNVSKCRMLARRLRQDLVLAFTMDDVKMVSCCSEFNQHYMPSFFGADKQYPILGMPRNDAFFQPSEIDKETWIDGIENKFVITYMPTHRAYGKGEVSPTPFANRMDVQDWLKKHNIILVIKNHPNMIPRLNISYESDVIKDITKSEIDPQVALYHSNVLITDYSSAWLDFLLLNRPIIFYYYDNYEEDDEGLLFSLRDDCPGHECYSEDELFELIKRCTEQPCTMLPSTEQIRKYHKFVDGNSCQRHFEYIINNCNETI